MENLERALERVLESRIRSSLASGLLLVFAAVLNCGAVTTIDFNSLPDSGDGWTLSNNKVILNGAGPYVLTGDARAKMTAVLVSADATVTISNLCLKVKETTMKVDDGKNLQLFLAGVNSLESSGGTSAAIEVEGSASIAITNAPYDVNGQLTAIGGDYSACIGCSYFGESDGGTVTILGGTIFARSEYAKGSGIGGGGLTGKVYIRGGNITSGRIGPGYNVKGGHVEIYGGQIDANACWGASGIGGTDTEIFICGGRINATGGSMGGIGGGYLGPASSVVIRGGTIVSGGDKNALYANKITIAGGSVNASSFNVSPSNDVGDVLVQYQLIGGEANSRVVLSGGYPDYYGQDDLYTDDSGRVYLWLPAGYSPVISSEAPPVRIGVKFSNPYLFRNGLSSDEKITDICDKSQQPFYGCTFGVQTTVLFKDGSKPVADAIALDDVKVYFAYKQGVEDWGWDHLDGVKWVPLKMVETALGEDGVGMTFRSSLSIPDSLVALLNPGLLQYTLKVVYQEDGVEVERLLDPFTEWTKPDWYDPIDFNAEKSSPSAYSIIETIAPDQAWINEVNVYDGKDSNNEGVGRENQYIEIAVPAYFDLTGWKLKIIQRDFTENVLFSFDGYPKSSSEAVMNGVQFMSIASPRTIFAGGAAFSSAKWNWIDTGDIKNGTLSYYSPFALVLESPCGAWRHVAVFSGTNPYSQYYFGAEYEPEAFANNFRNHYGFDRVTVLGKDEGAGSLSLTTVEAENSSAWISGAACTPNRINRWGEAKEQDIPPDWLSLPQPLHTFVYINTGDKVFYDGVEGGSHLVMALKGVDKEILFSTAEYYKPRSWMVNGQEGVGSLRQLDDLTYVLTIPIGDERCSVWINAVARDDVELPDGTYMISTASGGDFAVEIYDREATLLWASAFPNGALTVPSQLGGCPVREIADWAFANCYDIYSLVLPEGLLRIGDGAFMYCINLADVTLPSSLIEIGFAAFSQCESLGEILVPSGVSLIGDQAFGGNDSMLEIDVAGDNPWYKSIDGLLYDKAGETLLSVPGGLEEVSLPADLKEVGDSAFYFCQKIDTIQLPDSVRIVGDSAFAGCFQLTSILIPEGVTNIGHAAFQSCLALPSISLPSSVLAIGDTIFGGCDSLMQIDVAEGNANYKSVDGILCNAAGTCLLAWPEGRGEVSFPEDVVAIGPNAFYDFDKLTELVVPAQIQVIEHDAFNSCSNLKTVDVSEGVLSVHDSAFCCCTRLERVAFPTTLDYLGRDVFFLCRMLGSVTFAGNCPSFVGTGIYRDTPESLTTYVPFQSEGWGVSGFPSLWCDRPIDCYQGDGYYSETVDGYTWYFTIKDGMAEIGRRNDDGESVDEPAVEPASADYMSVPEYLLGCPVVSIGSHALARCHALVSLWMPDSVTNVGVSAFADCEHLEYVYLSADLKRIGQYAFAGCSALPYVDIPWSVEVVESAAFADCLGITQAWIGESVRDFGAAVFANCPQLEFIDVDANNPNFTAYNGMLVSKDLTKLYACPAAMRDVSLPYDLREIAETAFLDCGQIRELVIPEGVDIIGYQAMSRCPHLTMVKFEGDCPEQVASSVFLDSCEDLTVVAFSDAKGWPTTGTWMGRPLELQRREGVCLIKFDPCGGAVDESSRFVPAGQPIGELPIPVCEGFYFGGWRSADGEVVDAATLVTSDMALEALWLYEQVTENGTLYYRKEGGSISLVRCANVSGVLTLPAQIAGMSVVQVEDACFAQCTNLVSVAFPDTVTSIGAYAFYGCTNLSSVTFGKSIEVIHSGAFANCTSLAQIVTPQSLRFLGDELAPLNDVAKFRYSDEYEYETNIVERTEEYESTRYEKTASRSYSESCFGLGSFEGCESLVSVSLNAGLEFIGPGTFKACTGLKSLVVPNGVRRIGGQVVARSVSSTSFESSYYESYQSIAGSWSSNYSSEQTHAQSSDNRCFSASGFLEDCTALEYVGLPETLEYLGPYSFAGCRNLDGVVLPDSLTALYMGAFSGCKRMTEVGLPKNLEIIGADEVPYQEGSSYTYDMLSVNGGVPCVMTRYEYNCNTNGVLVSKVSENGGAEQIYTGEVYDSRWNVGGGPHIVPCWDEDLDWFDSSTVAEVAYQFGLAVTDEERERFAKERHSYFPSSSAYYTSGCGVFSGCIALRRIEIPETVKRIADWAFYDCCNITSIRIPDGLELLGYGVFGGESSLIDITTPYFRCGALWEIFPSHSYVKKLTLTKTPAYLEEPWRWVQRQLEDCPWIPEDIPVDERFHWLTDLERRAFYEDYRDGAFLSWDPLLNGFNSLEILELKSGLRSFDFRLGWECALKLKEVTYPVGLEYVGWHSFSEYRLNSVTFPTTLNKMGEFAFECSQVGELIFTGNAPLDVSPNVFAEESGWCPDLDARDDLVINVYPGTTGWNGEVESAALPDDGLWPTYAAIYKRREIRYIAQPLASVVGGASGDDAYTYFDAASKKLVTVPQSWLNEYGLLSQDPVTGGAVASTSPLASRSLYDSYVAGLNPVDENSQFKVKIEIVNNEPVITWEPELTPAEAALRKYTTYGCSELGGKWYNADEAPAEVKSQLRFFKVGVEMR